MAIKQTLSQRSGQSRKGFTLTEAAIVLGIVGLILGAIWVAAAAVYNNLRVNRTNQQLLQIVQTVRSMHATQQTIAAASTAQWIQAGVFPRDLVNAAGTDTINQWNGPIAVVAAATGTAFQVSFGLVPRAACVDMLVKNTGQGRDTGLSGAGASTTAVSSGTLITGLTNITATSNGLSVIDATSACANDTNTVAFTFNLRG